MAQLRAIGLSMVVTVGNEAALSATTVMRYLVRDPQTSVITAFLEAISDADEFRLAMTEAAAAGKPVVLLKVGRSEASRSAALDHTGAMTGDDDVVTTALSQLGVIRVRSLEDLIVTAGYLAKAPTGAGRRLAVVGASGGAGEIVADRAVDEGLELPALSEGTRTKLSEFLPEGATIGNPLDVTGRVVLDPELLTKAVETVRADSQMESVVVYTTLPRFPPDDSSALRTFFETLSKLNDEPGLPISVIAHGGADLSQFPDVVSAHRLPIFDNIEHAVIALGNAAWWQAVLARASVRPDANPRPRTPAAAAGEGSWGEWRARALLGEHGIPVTPGRLVHSAADAARVAQELATTVVAKAISDELLHKSDVGGVVLDIATPDDAGRAYEQIVSSVSKKRPDVVLDGVMIAPMRTGGVEVLVSVSTDAQWGKVLTVGLGGIWVELLADVSRRVLPVDAIEVEAMLAELRGARLLSGSRGQTPHDIAGLARVIHDIAAVGAGFGAGLLTLEVNPLWIRGTEVEVLDALVIWSSSVADSG
jgi:acyl-CoA synthetase (NDP forming)